MSIDQVLDDIRNHVEADDPDSLLGELIRQVALLVDQGHGTEADADELAFISERLQSNLIDGDLS